MLTTTTTNTRSRRSKASDTTVTNISVYDSAGTTLLATAKDGTLTSSSVLYVNLTTTGRGPVTQGDQYVVSYVSNGLISWFEATCNLAPADPSYGPYQFTLHTRIAPPGATTAPEATQYQVQIDMSADTANDLANGRYYLYGFKAVQTDMGGGAPVVWFATKAYSVSTAVTWQTQYQAYTSTSAIIPSGQVVASFAADIELGQVLEVKNEVTGIGDVHDGGSSSTAISIQNDTTTPFTTGISQLVGNPAVPSPLCAFPLYGLQLDVIAPIEKVLLMFSTQQLNTGAVIEQAYSTGILIDLTADNYREVSYDINAGWDWGGASWAQQVPPNADLVPMLIETPQAARVPEFRRKTLVT